MLLLAAVQLIIAPAAEAQSVWNATTGNWSTDANWAPVAVPTSGSSSVLIFGGNAGYTATNDIGNFALNQLQFTNTSGTVIVNGSPTTNPLDFVNNTAGAALSSFALTGAGSATVSTPIIFDGETSVTNSGSGTLLLNGNLAFANGTKQTLTNSGSGTLTLADAITYSNSGSNTGIVLNVINNNSGTGTFNVGNLGGLGNFTLNVGGTGTVRFSGSTGGDLFSGSAVLNVLSGATFDFNGNGESMGAISGAGTIRETNAGVNVAAAGYYVFSGKLTGTGTGATLAVSGAAQTLVLTGSTSDYAGVTSITAGRLIVSANAPSGSAGALGSATTEVLVGNTSGANNASLMIDTAGVTISRNIRLQSGNTGIASVGGLNTSGAATYSGNVTLGTNSGAAKGLTIYSASGGAVEFTGNLLRATSATGTTDTLTVNGSGTVALRGSNTFTGATTVNGGTLLLDDTTNNGNKLSSTAGLTLSGGSLSLNGSSSAASSQTVSGLTLGNSAAPLGGGARVTVTSGTDQSATLALGIITRNTGATVDFTTVNTGVLGVASITTSTSNNSAGILGAYATFNRDDWAVNDGLGNIAALGSGSYASSFASGSHTSLSASTVLPSGGSMTSTLRFTGAAALTYAAAADTLTLESGGILVATTSGATSIGTTTTRGNLATSTGELIIHQQSTAGALTINSIIGGTNLTKSGDGALILTGTNTYTGNTIINGGSVSVTATANLGAATADVTINGGTLLLPSGTLGTLNAANRVITVGPAGATFNFTANQSFEGSGLAGTGALTLAGTGTLAFGTSASTFTGDIIINAGVLKMNSSQLDAAGLITVNSGGTYNVEDDGVGTFNHTTTGGRFVINGNGAGGNGAIRLSDQTPTTAVAGKDPKTTLDREINLQTISRIQVDNGSAVGSLSQLILTGNVTGSGALVKSGNGLLVMTARDNSYSGGTTIENGTLRIDLGNDRLPTNTSVTLGAGTTSGVLQLNGFSQTIAGLSTAGTGTTNAVMGGSATATSLLDVNLSSGSQTYSGMLGGTGVGNNHANNNLDFIKDGAGSVTLTSANTYSGATTVAAGTLIIGNTNALGNGGASLATSNGGTTVNAGATLDLNGQSNVQEVINLNGSGVSNAGALINNSGTVASIGSGVASLSVPSVSTTGWSAGASVTIDSSGSGTTAVATAQLGLSAGSLSLTSGGSGFSLTNPVVTISGGGGSGAVVLPTLGVTTASFTITSGTTTYSVAPSVTIGGGAIAVANLDGTGKVTSITVTSPGSGFSATPTISFTGGTVLSAGTNPTGSGNSTHFTVTGFTIVNPGIGYTSVPTIAITGGTGATATVVDGNFTLNGFALANNGSGYTTAPNVSISGGSASATANLSAVNLATDSSVGGSGDIIINAPVTGNGGLNKVGSGTTTLSASNSYAGATTVTNGTLLATNTSGSATGSGHVFVQSGATLGGTGFIGLASGTEQSPNASNDIMVNSGGILQVGTTHGTSSGSASVLTLRSGGDALTHSGTITLNGLLELDIFSHSNGLNAMTNNDVLALGSVNPVNLGGTLQVKDTTATSSSSWIAGDAWQLFDWSQLLALTHNNSEFATLDLPTLGSGLHWDTTNLYTTGTIIVAAPEPGRAMLLVAGITACVVRRRRKGDASRRQSVTRS